ncbi:hypothetical protein Ddye_013030 [Dipteronia dyeriana]|uniref:Zinc knuckle CX2CX4HX4C domain-containing protein n=1 Tax=Dipteronia dyeriana TaxID=168575 RepID=A0AAD9X5I3_9ROSI|nr:hypothetical protein Ddye_013030 [Dipteronia dyeriana]
MLSVVIMLLLIFCRVLAIYLLERDIAHGIGVPLKVDKTTLEWDLGYYAHVLIDVDVSTTLTETLMLERNGGCLFISGFYENLPDFCNSCNSIGHHASRCHWNNQYKTDDKKRASSRQSSGRSKSRQVYRQEQQSDKLDTVETVEHVNVYSPKEAENPNSMLQEKSMRSHMKGNLLAMVHFVPSSLPNEISTQHVFLPGETSHENIATSSNAEFFHG